MVTYVDPFTPLSKTYPYWVIVNEDTATRLITKDAHLNRVGWMECPCRPLPEDICHSQWDKPASWKYELIKYTVEDLVHYLLYLHQTPIMQVTYQVGEGNRILLAWVFDSTGRMTNGTINAWNLFLNGKVTHPDGPGKLDWLIIRQKETRDSKDKVKMPYLFNLNTRERYPFKDGIMIEAIDVVMEWLGL